jgi:alkanesulfonate monooxygenase SsuD/methylene tetrahydromethanopterin reductase-like flavin-dependent oxidoreductase (luciferase family)
VTESPIRCGISPVLHGGFPQNDRPGLLRSLAIVADQGGFDTFWVEDHTRLPAEEITASAGDPLVDEPLDAWTTLAWLAGTTQRVRLGTEVTPVTLRFPPHIPVRAAQAFASGRAERSRGYRQSQPR